MTHLALTLGPITRTLTAARFTRELWSASYVLSWLSKEIIRRLREDKRRQFIIPYPDDENVFRDDCDAKPAKYKLGAGLFPDRIIFSTTIEDDFALTSGIIREVIQLLATETADHLNIFGKEREKLATFLDRYFHIFLIEQELKDGDNPVLALSPLLNAIEWQQSFSPVNQRYLALLFDRSTKSFLVKDGFCKEKHSFETLIEIALRDYEEHPKYLQFRSERTGLYDTETLKTSASETTVEEEDDTLTEVVDKENKEGKNLDNQILSAVKKANKETFKVAHKYVAIVQSDGDNVGKIIETLKGNQFRDFSQDLHEFALESVEDVSDYGGMPVYAGGDDLLFFAPVVRGDDHIFRLLKKLDDKFKARFKNYNTNPPPSLSFGVSISYYKYPLAEALDTAIRDLLFGKAKHTGQKNNAAWQLLKHSGAAFGGVYALNGATFAEMMSILQEGVEEKQEMLSSIIYKIRENENLFGLLGAGDPEALGHFIKNSFNEPGHEKETVQAFFEAVKRLIAAAFQEAPDTKTALGNLYGTLRLVSFLQQKDLK